MILSSDQASLAFIGGTGFEKLPNFVETGRYDYETPFGAPSSPVIRGELFGEQVAFVSRHGEEHTIPPHKINYRANTWALNAAGISTIVGLAAVGGIDADMVSGCIVIPDQLIDYTWGREHTYYDGMIDKESGVSRSLDHIEFASPYSNALRKQLIDASGEAQIDVFTSAVYGVSQGPRLETAAEINKMERDGVKIIGMTGLPEASLARELRMSYATLAMVVNEAAGRGAEEITMDGIRANLITATSSVARILEYFVRIYSEGQTPRIAPNFG
jgi:5'-deoxy-5'-methylthioadenosine phosphorylase